MDLLSIILLCLCLISWFLIQSLHGRRTRARLPPGPKPFPLFGNLFHIGAKPHISLTNLSQQYGSIISVKLGQVTTVVVSSPSMAKEILRNHDQLFYNRTVPDAMQGFADNSFAWMPVSPRWRHQRRICTSKLFALKALEANQENRRAKAQELIDGVNESMVKGFAVYIGKAAFRATLNLLSRTLFSIDLADGESSTSSKVAKEFLEIVTGMFEEAGKPNLGDYFPILRKLDPQGRRRRFTKYYNRLLGFLESVISQRLKSRKGVAYVTSNDMLDILIDICEEENDENFSFKDIQHMFGILLVAGTESTSMTVEWAMAELLHSPKCLSKAQEELHRTIGKGRLIEESDIVRLPYLQAIIKENFRLHPVAPLLLPRKAETDVEIEGYVVPKGAQVLVNIFAIGRDSNIWENPNPFTPERFLESENQIDVMGKDFELIPFGGGRRICPGIPLAMRMLHSMLGSLINCFDWRLEDGVSPETMNLEDEFSLSLHMAQPLKAVPMASVME